jgi:hypothetical protein
MRLSAETKLLAAKFGPHPDIAHSKQHQVANAKATQIKGVVRDTRKQSQRSPAAGKGENAKNYKLAHCLDPLD